MVTSREDSKRQAFRPIWQVLFLPFATFAYLPECSREFHSPIFRLYPGLKFKGWPVKRKTLEEEGTARDHLSSFLLVCKEL
jgi:hypothetical protein